MKALAILKDHYPLIKELSLVIPNLLWMIKGILMDHEVTKKQKFLLVGLGAYILITRDLISSKKHSFLGYTDDAAALVKLLRLIFREIPLSVSLKHYRGDSRIFLQIRDMIIKGDDFLTEMFLTK